jgi:hypothetical protein
VRQQPNSAPVSPLNLDEARRLWHRATEVSRQRALVADTELRRRHPGMQFPPLRSGDDLVTEVSEHDVASDHPQQERGEVTLGVAVALEIARQVRAIVRAGFLTVAGFEVAVTWHNHPVTTATMSSPCCAASVGRRCRSPSASNFKPYTEIR